MKNYKVLFCNLDGTLIRGCIDIEFRFEVLNAIKKLKPKYVFIVSNQDDISKGIVNIRAFQHKSNYVSYSVEDYCKCECVSAFCFTDDPNNEDRKPNTGMLDFLSSIHVGRHFDKKTALMIGDDIDKQTAKNFNIDYMSVEDFVKSFGIKYSM